MRDAEQGTYNGEPTYCTVNCWNQKDCPHAKEGICHAPDPVKDCLDFSLFFPTWKAWEEA